MKLSEQLQAAGSTKWMKAALALEEENAMLKKSANGDNPVSRANYNELMRAARLLYFSLHACYPRALGKDFDNAKTAIMEAKRVGVVKYL